MMLDAVSHGKKILDGINVICIECGADLTMKVRIQNDAEGYVKCLYHGLGVKKTEAQP